MMKLLVFGEVLWDVYPDGRFIGGAPLNFAAHCVKQGEEAFLLSSVGADELGAETLERVRSWNVRTPYVSVLPDYPTGQCLVTLNEQSVPHYHLLTEVAWDYIDGSAVRADEKFDVLYFGTLPLRSAGNRKTVEDLLARVTFDEVFVDVNIRPPFYSADTIRFALENATIAKISDEELPVVMEQLGMTCPADLQTAAAAITGRFPRLRMLILTCGAEGACAYRVSDGHFFRVPSCPAKVVSTVGAGDSFSASFLHKWLEGAPVEECLTHASAIAAWVVSHYDAIPDYPEEKA